MSGLWLYHNNPYIRFGIKVLLLKAFLELNQIFESEMWKWRKRLKGFVWSAPGLQDSHQSKPVSKKVWMSSVMRRHQTFQGLWYYREELPEGVGRVNKRTITNSSKEMNGFSDFPFPKDFPNYMHHKKLYQYFESYAKKFNLFPHILFEHSVINVEKNDDYDTTHSLKVTVKNNQDNSTFTEVFEGVMLCTGHHTTPRWPHFPGQEPFKGEFNERESKNN